MYFAFWEGLWGRSVGKWLLGLRCADRGRCARLRRRAAARAAVFGLLVTLPEVLAGVAWPRTRRAGLSLLPLLVGLVIVGFLMRRSNDFRGCTRQCKGRGCCGCRSSPGR